MGTTRGAEAVLTAGIVITNILLAGCVLPSILMSVSYTHLDVYKRQAILCGECDSGNHSAVNFLYGTAGAGETGQAEGRL